jgi:hypothetical protein
VIAIAVNTFRSRIRTQGQPLLSLDPNRVRAPALPERYRDAILDAEGPAASGTAAIETAMREP